MRCRVVAQSTFRHGPERLRSFRADVSTQAVDGLEALLTRSWPGCCSNVNKQGERASGVIRPKGGGTLPSITVIFFSGSSVHCYILTDLTLIWCQSFTVQAFFTDVCCVCVIRLRHSAIRIDGL